MDHVTATKVSRFAVRASTVLLAGTMLSTAAYAQTAPTAPQPAPAATPAPILDRLNEVIVAALKTPEVTERLARVGFAVDATDRPTLARLIAADLARWRRVVRDARIDMI